VASASNLSIFGTLSNFDTYNTTGSDSEGAELELEGIHSVDVVHPGGSTFCCSKMLSVDATDTGLRMPEKGR
jgi:hypothetical protein